MMTDQDRIRVWNEETHRMMEPATISEMLRQERNNGIAEGWADMNQFPVDSDEYGHLVFMRNTGIYDHPSEILPDTESIEIFAEDLVIHATEPWVYRVMQKRGCWWAISLWPAYAMSRPLCNIFHPEIVGNVFENRELLTKGEIIDE